MRPSVGEDLAQGSGEGVRLAHAAVFAAKESVVAAGGGDGLRSEPFGHRCGPPARHGAHRRANEKEDRLGTSVIAPDIVVQHRAYDDEDEALHGSLTPLAGC